MIIKHIRLVLLLLLFLPPIFSACYATSSQTTTRPAMVIPTRQPTAPIKVKVVQRIPAPVALGDELSAFIAIYGHPKFQYDMYDFGIVQGTVYSEGLVITTISDKDSHIGSITFVINKVVATSICNEYNPADSKLVIIDALKVTTYRSTSLKKELPARAWVGTGNGQLPDNQTTGPLPDNPPGEFVVGSSTDQGKTTCMISL